MENLMRGKRLLIFIVTFVPILVFIYNQQNNKNTHTPEKISNFYNGKYIPDKTKYLVFQCNGGCGGYGDRMKGIMNVYMWAILTNRSLLINMMHPCDISQALNPNKIQWNNAIPQSKSIEKLNLIDNKNFKENMVNFDLLNYSKNTDVIVVETNNDWLYYMSQNTRLHSRIQEIGIDLNEFKASIQFHSIYQTLFKLSPNLQQQFDTFLKNAKPHVDSKLICIQIRIGGSRPNVQDDFQFTSLENSKMYWNFIQKNILPSYEKSNYKIFITTDTESVQKECIEVFGENRVVFIDGVFAHIDRTPNNGNQCKLFEKVILDFHALQMCDEALVSMSGFGRLGVMNRMFNNTFKFYAFDFTTNLIHEKKMMDFNDVSVI